jgi:hypothetical protein
MLILVIVLLVITGAVVEMATAGLISVLKRHEDKHPAALVTAPQFPPPRLQSAPRGDLKALRAREELLLNGYGWVDRKAKIVHIPVDRAMDLLVQRGLPETAQAVTPAELQQMRPRQNPVQTEVQP